MSARHHLGDLLGRLVSPQVPLLEGRRGDVGALPNNVICFQRTRRAELQGTHSGQFLHHRFTLILSIEGDAQVSVDGATHLLGPGEALLVFPFQFHHYPDDRDAALRWLFVTFEMVDASSLAGLQDVRVAFLPPAERSAAALVQAFLEPDGANQTVLRLAALLQDLRQAPRATPPPAERGDLVRLVDRIAGACGAGAKVKEIAQSLGVSVSHVRAQFHLSSGVPLGRHLRRMRLERARGLIEAGRLRVTEVAELTGFSSVYVFSRAFRQAYGLSPLAFAKARRAQSSGGGADAVGGNAKTNRSPAIPTGPAFSA